MLDFIKLSVVMWVIVTLLGLMILGIFALYIISIYHFGKPLSIFFFGRLKSWTNKKLAIFEIFTLNHDVIFAYAIKGIGGTYREDTEEKKLTWFEKHIERKQQDPTTRGGRAIIPKSTYTVNGVTTIPLLNIHPELSSTITTGLKLLTNNKITTLGQLIEAANKNPQDILYKGFTYKSFLELYLSTIQKYNIRVTAGEVVEFIGKNTDENFRETIDAKTFNVQAKAKIDNKYLKYGYIGLIVMAVGLVIKIIYVTVY